MRSLSNRTAHTGDDVSDRVSALEESVIHITKDLGLLRVEISSGFERIYTRLENLNDQRKVSWPLIFTAVATLISISVVAGVVHQQSLRPLDDAIIRNREEAIRHEKMPGHLEALLISKGLEGNLLTINEELKQIQTKLENHISIPGNHTDARVMQLLVDQGEARLKMLEGKITELRSQVDKLRP